MDREELNSEMLEAAKKGDFDRIWKLVERGADVNASNKYGWTALTLSAWKGHLTPELLNAFISHEADINAQNEDGETALMYVAEKGHLTPELLGTFISNGADINARNKWGNTALMVSARNSYLTPELLEAFASNGAQINVRNKLGETALMRSEEKGHLTPNLAHAYAEQFIRLGTSIEEIYKQTASSNSAAVLVCVLLDRLETEPGLVVDFMKKHVGKNLQKWVDNGVEGANTLVSRLVPYIKDKNNIVGDIAPDAVEIDFF